MRSGVAISQADVAHDVNNAPLADGVREGWLPRAGIKKMLQAKAWSERWRRPTCGGSILIP
jgi:hypothetical protein